MAGRVGLVGADGAPFMVDEARLDEQVNEKISQVYKYTALAFAASCATAVVTAATGLPLAMYATPALAVGSTLGLTAVAVGLIWATVTTPKEESEKKHLLYGLFSVCEGIVLSPLVLLNPMAFGAAAITTVGITGVLGAGSMILKESFERYERILQVALGAIAFFAIGSLFLGGVAGELAHQVSLVGGMALFSAFVIYDTHKARTEARERPERFDPVDHSVGIYLDGLNLLVRIWECYDKRNNR